MGVLRDLAVNLRASSRLAFFRPVSLGAYRTNADQVALLLVISILLAVAFAYIAAGPTPTFSSIGVLYLGTAYLVYLASLFLIVRLHGHPARFADLLVVATGAGVWLTTLAMSAFMLGNHIRGPIEASAVDWNLGVVGLLYIGWSFVIFFRAARLVLAVGFGRAAIFTVIYGTASLSFTFAAPDSPLWIESETPLAAFESDSAEDSHAPDWSAYQALDQERVYYRQQGLMDQTVGALAAERSAVADLYFVGYGGHAYQDVFMKEVLSVRALFDRRFDTQGRSVALVNNLKTVDFLPLANQHNLAEALGAVAERMNTEEDVLFLFLTSHGSEDHRLSTDFWPFGLNDLSAERLDALLDASGIKWRIVVVSACYSGGFIAPLQDDNSLILTASRADRNSFGCGHLNDFTYFGQAYFDQQLRRQTSFVDAFHNAVEAIAARELDEDLTSSEPQIFVGQAMAGKLIELESRLAPLAEVHTE